MAALTADNGDAAAVQHGAADDENALAAECGTSSTAQGHGGRQLMSVAPMMDWTDVHFRQLARLLSRHTWLWTEMVVDKTIIHNPQLDKFLWFPPEQHPVVLQLGGSNPSELAAAAAIAARYGYDEINLNCGCPSDRVAGAGCFGAALMLEAELVGDCMAAISGALAHGTPVTVKCRLGVDDADSYDQLRSFVRTVSERSPTRHFILHTRKCFLKGLNPHQNRTVPPLRPEWAWALAAEFPHLRFSLNGGVLSAHEAASAIETCHPGAAGAGIEGVMIGRAAYNDPWGCLADADRAVFGAAANAAASRRQVLRDYTEYADAQIGRWAVKADGHRDPSVRTLMKPILNLFHGAPKCKKWKATVDEVLKGDPPSVSSVLDATLHIFPDEVLDAPPAQPERDAWPQFSLAPDLPTPSSRAGKNQDPPGQRKAEAAAAEPLAAAANGNGAADAGSPLDGVAGNGGDHGASGRRRAQARREGLRGSNGSDGEDTASSGDEGSGAASGADSDSGECCRGAAAQMQQLAAAGITIDRGVADRLAVAAPASVVAPTVEHGQRQCAAAGEEPSDVLQAVVAAATVL